MRLPKREVVQRLVEDIADRKKAEETLGESENYLEKLRESEEKFRNIFESANDCLIYLDKSGRILDVNRKAVEVFGGSKKELLGKHFAKIGVFSLRDIPRLMSAFAKGLAGKQPTLNVRIRNKRGQEIHLECLGSIMKTKDKPTVMIIARDVTERRKAEEALRESEEKYRTQFEEALDAIFLADAETGIIIDCNRAASELVGREKSELVGKHQRIVHPPQEIEGEFSRTFRQHLEEKEGQVLETQVITKKGEIKDVAIKANSFEFRGKKLIQGIFRDTTERKKMEDALRESEEKYRNMVELAPDLIVTVDKEGVIISCNSAAELGSGYSADEIIGKHFLESPLLRGIDATHAQKLFGSIIEGELLEPIEMTWLNKDGASRISEIRINLMKKDGRTIGFTAIARDITDRKKMEEALTHQRDIAITFSGARNFSEALNRLFDNLLEIEEFDCAGFYLVDKDTGELDMVVHRGLPHGFVEKGGHLDADTSYAKVVKEGKPIYQKTSDFPPVIKEDLQSDGILSVAAIPISYKGEVIGDLNLASHTHDEIPASTRHLLESVGAQIGETLIRARMEEELRKSESKSRTLLENLPQKIFFKDKNSVYISCNENYARDLKIKSDEIRGKTDYDFYPKKLAEKYRADDKRIMESGKTEDIEEEYIQDGQKVFVHTVKTPVKDENGNVVGILGIFWDITERKKGEEELIRLSSAVKMSTDSIVISGLDGKIVDVNEATLKMYGTDDKRDLIGKGSFDLIAPEEREKAVAGMKETLEKGYTKNREYHVITKDSGRIPVEMSAAIMKDADGKPIGFVGISRDITQRRRAEEALKESEEKFRNIFEGVNDEILYLDKYGKIVDVNKRVKDIFGYTPDEVIGKNFARLGVLQLKDLPIILKQFMDAMRGGVVYPLMEFQLKDKKGNKVAAEASTRLIKKDGKIEGLLVIVRDIRERKKMEEKLRQYSEHLEELIQKRTEKLLESEKRYSVLVEEASDGVAIIQDGKIVFANKRASEISDFSRDELIGLSLEKLMDERYYQLVKKRYMRRMQGETVPVTYEVEFIAKTGEQVPVEVSATLIRYQGHPADLIIVRDIRERKRIEEERLRLEKLATIGELATMVGHDLRNPLQSIENATYYLNNELPHLSPSTPSPQKTMEMLQVINDSVNYADRIIRDLQDFSATKKPILKKTDINALVKETLSQVETAENVKIVTNLGSLPEIKADRDMLKRTFLNLTVNGIQAMEKGGTLKASTKRTKGFVEVSFKDTGVGISKESMKKLFTPFFTTKAKGMGMGLAICKRFAEAHGGTIEVESEEGKGSTFTVKLPIQYDNGGEKA